MKHKKWIVLPILVVLIFLVVALNSQSSEKYHKIKDLEYALESEDADVRIGAIVELAGYGKPAIPIIEKALNDKDINVGKTAVKALATIGGKQAADALAVVLTNPNRSMRTQTVLSLSVMGRLGLPHLLQAIETDPFPRVRLLAADGITRVSGPGDAPEILKRFERQDKATKMHLIIALVKIGDDEALAGLHRLVQSSDPLVRFYVASTIAEAPEREALPILIDAMDDEAPEVRMWAMFGLEKLNLPESYPFVLTALKDEEFYIRKEAAYTLGTLGKHDAIPLLIPYLKDPHYLVRASAAESLGMLGDPIVIPEIRHLLAEDNEAVQIRASEALAHLNDYGGMEKLILILDSPHHLYRKEAYGALQRISNEDFGNNREAWSRWWEQAKENTGLSRSDGSGD
jgi:HEAT repeat protein